MPSHGPGMRGVWQLKQAEVWRFHSVQPGINLFCGGCVGVVVAIKRGAKKKKDLQAQ